MTAQVRLLCMMLIWIFAVQSAHATSRPASGEALQLEVIINGTPSNLIGAFVLLPDDRIGALREELEEIGLQVGAGAPNEVVVLNDIPGLSYRYSASEQRLWFNVRDELRKPRPIEVTSKASEAPEVASGYGAVLNYNLFGNSVSFDRFAFSGASATLDGRAFSPFGVLSQSAILRTSPNTDSSVLRLNTTFSYSDMGSLRTYRAGDVVSGGLVWTRPLRMAGVQIQRNFAMRPDLVTMPLPAFRSSAAVPSTVEVYIDNLKSFSAEVPQGPFTLTNIPTVSGPGRADVVIRDSAGHEMRQSLPFFASAQLLAPGLTDFSFEGGVPRIGFGTSSDTYGTQPIFAASVRRGIFDWLTLETHAEAGLRLLNGGVGASFTTGGLGIASVALSGSTREKKTGLQLFGGFETSVLGVSLSAGVQRALGDYEDLASRTAALGHDFQLESVYAPEPRTGWTASLGTTSFGLPPRALYRFSAGLPLPFDTKSSVNLTYLHIDSFDVVRRDVIAGSWSRSLDKNGTFAATAFADLADKSSLGVFLSYSLPLGPSIAASVAVTHGAGGSVKTVDAVKPLGEAPGDYGWRVQAKHGSAADAGAAVAYRSSYGKIEASLAGDVHGARATAEIDGAVAAMGSGVFFANRIDDAFAVVDVGIPGVKVFHENRLVAHTDKFGKAFLPGLRSYQKNKVAIDPTNAPLNAHIASTQEVIVPAEQSGVRVPMAIETDSRAAVVVLIREDGKPVPPAARGELGHGSTFVVGYDGRSFIENLSNRNEATVALPDGSFCRATFDFAPREDQQVVVSALCR